MKGIFPTERAIEDFVWNRLKSGEACPIADETYSFCLRQKEIKGYGVTDIIKFQACESVITITVLELKNENLKEAHVSQLYRYMTGIRRIAEMYSRKIEDCPEIVVIGELAGPFDQDRGDIVWLLQELDDIWAYEVSLDFEHGFQSLPISRTWRNASENRLSYKNHVRDIASIHRKALQAFLADLEAYGNVTSINGDSNA